MTDKKLDVEYLRQQLKTSNRHFAEIVLRTYYFIVQKCRENNHDWCFNKEIKYKELKKFTYKNIGYSASLMADLQLKYSNDVDLMLTEFINFKNNFMRENSNSKVANGDLTVLMKISCSLSEELKYQKNLERQYGNLKSRNERARKLLTAFKEILQYDSSYACYIEEINNLIEQQITNNEILSYKDFSKTIAAIEKKKAKIDEQIKTCNIGLNKGRYEDIWKIIGHIEQNFEEIKKYRKLMNTLSLPNN